MQDDAERRVTILVRSLYRELVAQGFDDKQILAVAIELVGKVTDRAHDRARSVSSFGRVARDQPKRRIA